MRSIKLTLINIPEFLKVDYLISVYNYMSIYIYIITKKMLIKKN